MILGRECTCVEVDVSVSVVVLWCVKPYQVMLVVRDFVCFLDDRPDARVRLHGKRYLACSRKLSLDSGGRGLGSGVRLGTGSGSGVT